MSTAGSRRLEGRVAIVTASTDGCVPELYWSIKLYRQLSLSVASCGLLRESSLIDQAADVCRYRCKKFGINL